MWMAGSHVLDSILTLFLQLLLTGEVLPVLARPGLLDLWEHPSVCRGLRGSGGLHHPQVLHPSGTHERLLLASLELGGGALQCTPSMAGTLTEAVAAGLQCVTDCDRASGSRS